MEIKTLLLTIVFWISAATPLAAQTVPENMSLIPAGEFWMGRVHAFYYDSISGVARDKMDDLPANKIYLDAFHIDKYEVTNADYARFIEAAKARPPWHWPEGNIPKGEEHFPVSNLNWFEANSFCNWMGKRLPTEAEWEKASRGGLDRNRFSWGDDKIDMSEPLRFQQAYGPDDPHPAAVARKGTMPVGSFPPNGYGLYDMTGNVTEWTNDWYDSNYYPFMPKRNPKGPDTGIYKSIRGANYTSAIGQGANNGDTLMNHYRDFTDPDLRSLTIGMRCAK